MKKKSVRVSFELPVWTAFVIRKIAEKRKKTVGEIIQDSLEYALRGINGWTMREWSSEFRTKYRKWLDD